MSLIVLIGIVAAVRVLFPEPPQWRAWEDEARRAGAIKTDGQGR